MRSFFLLCFVLMMAQVGWAADHNSYSGGLIYVFTPQNNNWLSDYVVNSSGEEVRLLGDGYYEREIAISGSFNSNPTWTYRENDGSKEFYVSVTTPQTLSIMNLFQGDWVKIFYWSGSSKQPEMKSSNTSVAKGSKVASGDPNNGGQGLVTMNSTGSMDFSIPNGMFITKIEVYHANTNNRIAFSTDGQESGGYYLCRLSSRQFNEPTLSVYPSNATVTYTVETYDQMNGTKLNDVYHEVAMMNTEGNKKGDVLFKNLGWCKVTATANGQSASYWVECWDNEAHGELQADGMTYKLVKVEDGNGDLLPNDQQGGVLKERVVTAVPGIEMKFGIPAHDLYDYQNDGTGLPGGTTGTWAQQHDNTDNHFQPNTTVVYRQVVDGTDHMVSFTNNDFGWWDRYPYNDHTWPHQGTFYQFKASAKGKLYVGGYKSKPSGEVYIVNLIKVNDRNYFIQKTDPVGFYEKFVIEMQPGDIYMMHGQANNENGASEWAPFLLEWFRFEPDMKLSAEWGVAANSGYEITNGGSVTARETVTEASGATCTVVECKGNIQSASASIDGSGHIVFSNIQFTSTAKDQMGGSMKVDIAVGTSHLYYYFTIPYGQHVWDFRKAGEQSQEHGDYSYSESGLISMMNDNTEDWTRVYKVHRRENGKWIELKDAIMAARSAIAGNNAFYMDNTTGLAFTTNSISSFGAGETSNNASGYSSMTQDEQYYLNYETTAGGSLLWMQGTSSIYFPGVKAGQYIKIYTYRHSDGKGETFKAKNLVDLDNVPYNYDNTFIMRGMWDERYPAYTGDIIKGGAIFRVPSDYVQTNDKDAIPMLTLADDGWVKIYKIEIMDEFEPDLVMTEDVSTLPVDYDGVYGSVVIRNKQQVIKSFYATTGQTHCQHVNTCDYEVIPDDGVQVSVERKIKNSKEDGSGVDYNQLFLRFVKGTGLVKVIQRERANANGTNATTAVPSSALGYVIDKNEYYIAVGELDSKTYPFTWDFTDYNMYQGSSTSKTALGSTTADKYGNWNAMENEGEFGQKHMIEHTFGEGSVEQVATTNKQLFAQGSQLTAGTTPVLESEGLGFSRPKAAQKEYQYVATVNGTFGVQTRMYDAYDLEDNGFQFTGQKLVGAGTIIVPDVAKDMYVFVKGTAPSGVSRASKDESLSPAAGVSAYKVTSDGDVVLSFNTNAEIEMIGVTDITKSINELGYATESRNHAIDHTYTGKFTKNDVDAYGITLYGSGESVYVYKGYPEVHKSETEVTVVPENTGVVLYKDGASEKCNVPLFYPACNILPTESDEAILADNWMAPNVESLQHISEVENRNGTECTKFVMTRKYYIYNKSSQSSSSQQTSQVEAFYRWKIENDATYDTMGANKAYLLVPNSAMPLALWNGGDGTGTAGKAKNTIFIDLEEIDEEEEEGVVTGVEEIENVTNSEVWYTLEGIRLNERPYSSGIYLRNGKKVYIK